MSLLRKLQKLSYDPVFLRDFRKAVGLLALLEVVCWILVCIIGGLIRK